MSEDALIRLDNLRMLLRERQMTPTRLAAHTGKSQSYYRDLLKGRKSFGEKAARALEKTLSLPHGWLDLPHDSSEVPMATVIKLHEDTKHEAYQAMAQAHKELATESEFDHNTLSSLAKKLARELDAISDDEKKLDAFLAALREIEDHN